MRRRFHGIYVETRFPGLFSILGTSVGGALLTMLFMFVRLPVNSNLLTAKEIVAQNETGKDNEHGKDAVVHKKHNCHSNRYPKKDKTNHSFHT